MPGTVKVGGIEIGVDWERICFMGRARSGVFAVWHWDSITGAAKLLHHVDPSAYNSKFGAGALLWLLLKSTGVLAVMCICVSWLLKAPVWWLLNGSYLVLATARSCTGCISCQQVAIWRCVCVCRASASLTRCCCRHQARKRKAAQQIMYNILI